MTSFPTSVWDGDSGNRDSDSGNKQAPDYRDWCRLIEEMKSVQSKILNDILNGIGDTNIIAGLSTNEVGNDAMHRTTLILTDVEMQIIDTGANGAHGSIKLYTFPAKQLKVFSGSISGDVLVGTGGITNTAVLDIGIGVESVSVANEILSNNEQNITTKDDITLTGGSKAFDAIQTTTQNINGTLSIKEIFLNVAVENASCTSDDILTISCEVTLLWSRCN